MATISRPFERMLNSGIGESEKSVSLWNLARQIFEFPRELISLFPCRQRKMDEFNPIPQVYFWIASWDETVRRAKGK